MQCVERHISRLFLTGSVLLGLLPAMQGQVIKLTNPSGPYHLEMKIPQGLLSVEGYNGNQIIIESKKETPTKFRTLIVENRIIISGGVVNKNDKVTLKVPRKHAVLRLGVTDNGQIEVSNVEGEVEASNVNGGITMNNISGAVVASTVNGDILVQFTAVDPAKAMAFSTVSGKIDIRFPAAIRANIRMKSDYGKVFSEFELRPVQTGESQNTDRFKYGRINGGGPEFLLKNISGNIYCKKII